MKKILLIPFMLLCMMLFIVPGFAMENEPDNFRGIPWGAPLPKNNLFGKNKWGLTHMNDVKYERSEVASIGGAKNLFVIYEFYDDFGFASVSVEFHRQENYDLIRKACIENWGEPDAERSFTYQSETMTEGSVIIKEYWLGKNITVLLQYEPSTYESSVLSLSVNNYSELVRKNSAKRRQRNSGL